jgi:hypothetical protein
MTDFSNIIGALLRAIGTPGRLVDRQTVRSRSSNGIGSWLRRLLNRVRRGTTPPWRRAERVADRRTVVLVSMRDVPQPGSYADALKQTAAQLRRASANQTLAARIRHETELWDRIEHFPVDAYWKHATRLHDAGVDVLSCVSISRCESRAILDLLAGRPAAATPPAPEALLLLDVAPEEPSSHRL